MTKKILTVLLLAAILFTFASCIHTPDGDGEKEMKYSDIYKYTPSESEELSGKVTYKASYGYVGKQGRDITITITNICRTANICR